MHRLCTLMISGNTGKGRHFFMYERKSLDKKLRAKRNHRGGLLLAVLLIAAIAAGIPSFTSIMVFAASESSVAKTAIEQKHRAGKIVSSKKIDPKELAVRKMTEHGPALIVVDAGHGGVDDGCLGGGLLEKDINLQIALLVKEKLEKKGFQVMMPRETDEYLAIEERVELANSYQADAFISIHQNTYEGSDKSVCGIETWYDGADSTRDNEKLAKLVHQEALKSTGANPRELWDIADYCVTNKTLMPACLIETGFLSNPEEGKNLSTKTYQERLAEGIATGVERYIDSL